MASSPSVTKRRCTDDAVVRKGGDLDRFAGCTALGSLQIDGGSKLTLERLGSVLEIRGDLSVGPTSQLTSLRELKMLRRVGGELRVSSNFQLGGVFLDALERVNGDLRVESNTGLLSVSLPALKQVDGTLSVAGNASLESLLLPALTRVDGDVAVSGALDLSIVVLASDLEVGGGRHIESSNRPNP